jgi:hypothetical protein
LSQLLKKLKREKMTFESLKFAGKTARREKVQGDGL